MLLLGKEPLVSDSKDTIEPVGGFLGEMLELYDRHLDLLPDEKLAVNYIMSITLAGCRKEVPNKPWGWVEGPTGCGKTESMLPLSGGYSSTLWRDDFTSAGLVSAYGDPSKPDYDPSCIKEANNKTLITKDCSAIATKDIHDIGRIAGRLAGLHDEFYDLHGGVMGNRHYEISMGFLVATTPLVDAVRNVFQRVGNRLLSFRFNRNNYSLGQRLETLNKVQDSSTDKVIWRAELRELVHDRMKAAESYLEKHYHLCKVSSSDRHSLSLLADLGARLRSAPVNGMPTPPEVATRLVGQLRALGTTHAILCKRKIWGHHENILTRRVLLDTMPQVPLAVFIRLYKSRQAMSPEMIHTKLPIPTDRITETLEQFLEGGLVEATKVSRLFKLTTETIEVVEMSDFFSQAPCLIVRPSARPSPKG